MKLFGPHGPIEIKWLEHVRDCEKCQSVDVNKSASFSLACAQGSPLLMEEMKKRQAPVERQKAKEVEEWATKAGTFIKHRAKTIQTKYVEAE